MTHLSHAYPQGANLYFIFIASINDINEYLRLQYGILEAIQKAGAAISHHHGVGKQTAPWLEENIGKPAMDVLRVLRDHFDPHHIPPGRTLGLDMSVCKGRKSGGLENKNNFLQLIWLPDRYNRAFFQKLEMIYLRLSDGIITRLYKQTAKELGMSSKNWLRFLAAGLIWSTSFLWIKIALQEWGLLCWLPCGHPLPRWYAGNHTFQ